MKSEVYSWRVSAETRRRLELEARREGASIASLLDRMTHEWLEGRQAARGSEEEEQARLHAAAGRALGSIAGGNPRRSEEARRGVRHRLARRHGR